ncbi:MAG: aldehyde reductase [Anaerolineales bacterium]
MTESSKQETVLVTGGSGFIGVHSLLHLLQAGYQVRTTVRSLAREADVRAMLKEGGIEPGNQLSFFAADLNSDAGWPEAVANCDYVLHIASPFPSTQPKDENELIVPAREGALRVLRAARDAGVKRVVLTSSFAAIAYGQKPTDQPFTEENWTNLNANVSPYAKSKTLAERAAWDFIAKEGGSLELVVINPVGVAGPLLGTDFSSSIQLLQRLMNGDIPRSPRIFFNLVDVRDVANLHLIAMKHPAAKGQRFLATVGECLSVQTVANILRARFGKAADRVPTAEMPNWIVRFGGLFSPALKEMAPNLGVIRKASNQKATQVLGWSPRSNEEAILATGESLLRLGLLSNKG